MTTTTTPDKADQAARAAERARRKEAQKEKLDWMKAILADRNISSNAARVAAAAALNHAYSTGRVRNTQKELARVSGVNIRSVKRAVAELFEQKYWDIEEKNGANIYYLIPPAERIKLWDEEKREWEHECRRWLGAENDWKYAVKRWLNKESEYLWRRPKGVSGPNL